MSRMLVILLYRTYHLNIMYNSSSTVPSLLRLSLITAAIVHVLMHLHFSA